MKIAKVISEQEGLSPEKAQEIWDAFEKFGGYAFNKSHSVAYSLISYQSMWLKTHYPAEFFAAALTILGEDKHQGLVKDALTYGIRVLPPDVNVSSNRIEIRTLEDGSQVLFAPFSAVKGCSENGCQAIMRAREKVGGKFESLAQFEEAVEKRACNSRVRESLQKVGAFASIEPGSLPATDPERLRDQAELMGNLVIDAVKASRPFEMNPKHMSKTLLDLLNKTREDIAAKRGNNVDLTRLKDGVNYIRIFPNKDDPNGKFFQTFGMHYVKYQNEEGKEATNAYICEQHTHGRACQLCEMVMEGRARHKGNKAMEERIGQMRATPRYLVNGILSAREDFADAEKCQLIELPSTVFDDICKAITEDIADDIGNPLSKEEGYAFLIKRTGSGRDTKYDVSPKRKVYKGDIEDKFWNTQHDLIAYANQADETRLLSTVRTMGRLIGIAAPTAAATAPAISSTAKTSAAALPGFGSVTGHTEGATAVATAHTPASEPTSLVDEEILRAVETEFKPEASSAAVAVSAKESEAVAATSVAAASAVEDEGIDDLLKELESL